MLSFSEKSRFAAYVTKIHGKVLVGHPATKPTGTDEFSAFVPIPWKRCPSFHLRLILPAPALSPIPSRSPMALIPSGEFPVLWLLPISI